MPRPKIILDTRKVTTTGPDAGRYHIKIKARFPVIVNGEKTWVPRGAKTFVYATEAEFKAMPDSRTKAWQEKWDKVKRYHRKAEKICEDIAGLGPDQYITLMEGAGNFESVTGMFDWYIGECLKENEAGEARDGNAIALSDAKSFFVRYKGSDHISYAEITKGWLDDCKVWALTEKKNEKGEVVKRAISIASFYMYCRALRTVMNLAHDPFNKITKDSIPFGKGKGKFKLPSSSKKKRKIKLEISTEKLHSERDKILSYVSKFPSMNRYLNYWKISYFGNGANMADILRWLIGWYDLDNQIIEFERKKTENTEEDNEPIQILVGDELRELIAKERNKESIAPDDYIFPVLKKGMSSAQRKKAVKDFIILMNRSLKRAAKDMGLEIKLSSGSARYLMSTILDRAGISKSTIKDLLGHGSEAMQSHYASPYLEDLRKSINKLLVG